MTRTFRRRSARYLAAVFVVGLAGFMVMDRAMAPVGLADVVAASLVLATAVWAVLVGLMVPAVRASDDELVVRQPLSEWRVRWSGVTLPFGDDVRLRLSDGRVVRPWAFSPSIIAALLGDRTKVRMLVHLRDREIAGWGLLKSGPLVSFTGTNDCAEADSGVR